MGGTSINALSEYVKDVKAGAFPGMEHTYKMAEGEEEKLKVWINGPNFT